MENKSQYNEKWSRALVCSFSLPRARFPAKAYRARLFVIVILEGSPKKKSRVVKKVGEKIDAIKEVKKINFNCSFSD